MQPLPDPAAPIGGGGATPGAPPGTGDGSSCGVFDLAGCLSGLLNDFLRSVVTDALNPMLGLLGNTLLSTPKPSQLPHLIGVWTGSWEILLATYGLLILIAGIVVTGYETTQTRYTMREVAPRIVIGFLSGAMSLTVATLAIETTNAVTFAVLRAGVDETDGAQALQRIITSWFALDGFASAIFWMLMGLVMAGMLLALLLTWAVRVVITIVLIAGAPIALMFHALPHTDGIARWWWRTFAACLSIQIAQSLTLVCVVQVLLSPGGGSVLGLPDDDGFLLVLVVLALLYILIKIPFWLLAASRIGGSGRSLLGSLVRGFIAYKTLGLLTGRSSGGRGGGGGGGTGGAGGGPAPTPGPVDPYSRTRTTPDGQLMLPLEGLRRRRPPGGAPAPAPRPRRVDPEAGRQLALPLTEGDWPENRPVLGRDGQYRLPLHLTRDRTPPSTPPPGTPPQPRRNPAREGQQLELPLAEGGWPEHRPRLGRDGQYQLPLAVRRVPVPPRPAGSSRSAPPSGHEVRRAGPGQLALPLAHGDWPENRPVPGPDGRYRLPIRVPRVRRPSTPPPPAAAPALGRRGGNEQLELQFDPYANNPPLRGGQYPLPLEGLTPRRRTPTPTPVPPVSRPAVPRQAPRARLQQLPLNLPGQPPPTAAPPAAPPAAQPARRRAPAPAPGAPQPRARSRVTPATRRTPPAGATPPTSATPPGGTTPPRSTRPRRTPPPPTSSTRTATSAAQPGAPEPSTPPPSTPEPSTPEPSTAAGRGTTRPGSAAPQTPRRTRRARPSSGDSS